MAFYRSIVPVMCKNLPCSFLPFERVSASFPPVTNESAIRGFCSAGAALLKTEEHANNKISLQRMMPENIAQAQPGID